ncbi:hypothetical protein [Streptosporangium sp. NPDC049376]|uniref:hypothetical protein n=1 Tax=Streptosporangium sp. NPDC049376 TaxID=3366192 RepID=UPI0037AC3C41
MKFGDLTPGTLARIPAPPDTLTPDSVLPPAVQILTYPTPCRRRGCRAVEVMARLQDGGRPRLYHRLPTRPVVLITIAQTEEV